MISFNPLSLLENLSHSVAFCVLSRAGVSHNFPENILKKKVQIQVHVAGQEEAEEKDDADVGTDCQGRPRDNSIKHKLGQMLALESASYGQWSLKNYALISKE